MSSQHDTLSEWLQVEGFETVGAPGVLADVALVKGLLIAAAKERRAVSYSELLGMLGHRFTRPKMRAVCRTLDAVEQDADGAGLAVLVVRESDRLPGRGWWTGQTARGYAGSRDGREAGAHVATLQRLLFDRWAS